MRFKENNITGRDELLKIHSLVIGLPFYLLYSKSTSNTIDMMTILESVKIMPMENGHLKEQVRSFVIKIHENIHNGDDSIMDNSQKILARKYLEELAKYLPKDWALDFLDCVK